ncbi:hypothetical protein [Gemmobacter aquatilis]
MMLSADMRLSLSFSV